MYPHLHGQPSLRYGLHQPKFCLLHQEPFYLSSIWYFLMYPGPDAQEIKESLQQCREAILNRDIKQVSDNNLSKLVFILKENVENELSTLKSAQHRDKQYKSQGFQTSKTGSNCFLGVLLTVSRCCFAPCVRMTYDGKNKYAPRSYLPKYHKIHQR